MDPATLLYDARPTPQTEDERARRAEDTADAQKLGPAQSRVLKPWILPTANPFIKDPAQHHARPPGNPGGDLAFAQPTFDDSAWQPVTLPHDWAIAGPFNTSPTTGVGGGMGRLPSPGVGWYRRKLDVSPSDLDGRVFLDVDGAMSYATVWLNGHLVGGWPYGYASWRLDLTPYLHAGADNQFAIRLDNPPDFSRWYPGAGLYRNVWLTKTFPVHVAHWGTRVRTPDVSARAATIEIETTLDNDGRTTATVSVSTEIFALDDRGHRAGPPVASLSPATSSIAPNAPVTLRQTTDLGNPKLWGPPPTQKPHRYLAVTTLRNNGAVLDRYETPFGIREVAFKPDGVYVNGERVPLRGVNQHHDLGALGAAFNARAAERQLEILRDMGCNAIRLAHNPPAPELLDLTDRMGFLVIDELDDCWVRRKTPFDFHLNFPDWHEPDLRAMIARDRNHPSVFLWSVGNEVGEQYNGEEGAKVAREMVALAHDADPTRPATASMNFAKADSPFAAAMDVVALNYQGEGIRDTPEFDGFKGIRTPPQYDAFHARFPGKTIISSESAAALSSRGAYLFPVAPGKSNPTRDGLGGDSRAMQVSAYELHAADFGSSADKVFAALDQHPYVAGEFVWSGFDYLGEPTPYYDARSSYFGIVDLAGFPKDRFYLYQSHWRPDLPMAHLLPHWTWPEREGQVTPVHVFTSGDEAELFVNGISQGRKRKGAYEYRLRWDGVVYHKGELRVQAYRDGHPWATDTVRTADAPAQLRLTADRNALNADGQDLAFISLQLTDAHGTPAPRAGNAITFQITGPADLIATDNGDPTDMTPFPSPTRSAFNGRALAIVRTRPHEPGAITIMATSPALPGAAVTLRSR